MLEPPGDKDTFDFAPRDTLLLVTLSGTVCPWQNLSLEIVQRDKTLQKTYWRVLKPQMRFDNCKYFLKNVKFVESHNIYTVF